MKIDTRRQSFESVKIIDEYITFLTTFTEDYSAAINTNASFKCKINEFFTLRKNDVLILTNPSRKIIIHAVFSPDPGIIVDSTSDGTSGESKKSVSYIKAEVAEQDAAANP